MSGKRARCPVDADLPAAIISPDGAIRGLLRAASAAPQEWGPPIAVTLPAITVTAREMVAVLERVCGYETAALVDWEPDEEIAAIVRAWPSRLVTDRAAGLGLQPDESLEAIVRSHVSEATQAAR